MKELGIARGKLEAAFGVVLKGSLTSWSDVLVRVVHGLDLDWFLSAFASGKGSIHFHAPGIMWGTRMRAMHPVSSRIRRSNVHT